LRLRIASIPQLVPHAWCALSAGSVPVICIGFSVLLMPESPHRLVAQNCIEEAEHVLLKTLYNKAEASTHLVSWDLQALLGVLHWMEHSQNLNGMVHAAISPLHVGSRSQEEGV